MQYPKGALEIDAFGVEVMQGKNKPEFKEPLGLTFTCKQNGKNVPAPLPSSDSNHSNSI